jgi:chaperonin GroEL
MKKQVSFNKEAQVKLINGINILCDAVKSTLGAGGRTVLLETGEGFPRVTKDGVSVANSIDLVDPIENMGAQLIKQVARKTVQAAGDGTTTSCVLAQSIINKGVSAIEAGANPITLIKEIKNTSEAVISNLRKQSIDIKGDWDKVKQIALTSTNGDEAHAYILVDAMQKIGDDGVVMIEYGTGFETKVDIVKGMEFNSGYLSPLFTNNAKNECVLENPYIFLTVETISYMEQVLKALEASVGKQRPIVFISNNADGEGMASLVVQRTKGNHPICVVNAPSFGDKRKEHLLDIAAATGAKVFGTEFGKEMKNCVESDLGQCDKVIITKDKTIIIGGKGEQPFIDLRVETLRDSISKEEDEKEKDWYKERLAKLSGGIAIIKVGGLSPASIGETKDRLDDAMCATKAAIEEGIVPGGGLSFINAIPIVHDSVVYESCSEPFRQILINAGIPIPEILFNREGVKHGINVRTGNWENFIECGIIDATKVVVSALENAVDVACIVLQNNVVITNIHEGNGRR